MLSAIILTIIYLMPTVIAFCRGHESKLAITAMNIILGWTAIFWIWSFIWSLSNKGQSHNINIFNNNNNGG